MELESKFRTLKGNIQIKIGTGNGCKPVGYRFTAPPDAGPDTGNHLIRACLYTGRSIQAGRYIGIMAKAACLDTGMLVASAGPDTGITCKERVWTQLIQ